MTLLYSLCQSNYDFHADSYHWIPSRDVRAVGGNDNNISCGVWYLRNQQYNNSYENFKFEMFRVGSFGLSINEEPGKAKPVRPIVTVSASLIGNVFLNSSTY